MSLISDAMKLVTQLGSVKAVADENQKLKERIGSLEQENEELKKLLDVSKDMEFVEDGGFYVRKSETDKGKFIPYCPACFDSKEREVVHLQTRTAGFYSCSIHKENYTTAEYKDRRLG